MRRKIIVFVAIATVEMLTTVFSSTVFQGNSNFNNHSSYNTQIQASTFQEASNIEAMVQYTVQIGNGNNLSYYDVNSSVTLSGFSGESVNVHSTMSGGSQTYTLNESFSLSDFVSFENTNSYYNESRIPNPNGTGIFTTYIYSSAKDNLVNSISMLTIDNSYNFSTSLTIFMIKESGFNQLFRNTNYNTSMAYLFIPQLLPPSVNVNDSIVDSSIMVSLSPDIIKPPGGGGGGFGTDVTATFQAYDVEFVNIHLFDESSELVVTWTSEGGSVTSWTDQRSHTVYYSPDWEYFASTFSTMAGTNYFTSTYTSVFTSDFPYPYSQGYPFDVWRSYPKIIIQEFNDGSAHVTISNLVQYELTVNNWVKYSDQTVYNSNVNNFATVSVKQYILPSIL